MDRLLGITQNSSELSQDYYPPIELNPNAIYGLGLYSLNTYNSIPNIKKGVNDSIIFTNPINSENCYIEIPEGAYEIDQIASFLQEECTKYGIGNFQMKANLNTMKIELFSDYLIYFPEKSLREILGFSQSVLQPSILHTSDLPVSINSVNEINVECNIVEGSYRNGKKCHTLYVFYPDVEPGFKISIQPTQIVYLPVTAKQISNITLRLTDQHGQLVNFRGEEITIQLNLKQFNR